jgi:transposase-like protein
MTVGKYREIKPSQKARAVLQVLNSEKSATQVCREFQIQVVSHEKIDRVSPLQRRL